MVDNLNTPIEGFSAHIVVKPDQTPIFHAPYSVPYKLRDKFSDDITRLVKEKILVPVKRSKWASPVVIVPKSGGELRLCMDCKKNY